MFTEHIYVILPTSSVHIWLRTTVSWHRLRKRRFYEDELERENWAFQESKHNKSKSCPISESLSTKSSGDQNVSVGEGGSGSGGLCRGKHWCKHLFEWRHESGPLLTGKFVEDFKTWTLSKSVTCKSCLRLDTKQNAVNFLQ